MNRILGYEPYEGFEIHVFPHGEGKDFFGFSCKNYRGWAKRASDGKCMDGSVVHSWEEAVDEMKEMINAIIAEEERKASGLPIGDPAPSTFFGFK